MIQSGRRSNEGCSGADRVKDTIDIGILYPPLERGRGACNAVQRRGQLLALDRSRVADSYRDRRADRAVGELQLLDVAKHVPTVALFFQMRDDYDIAGRFDVVVGLVVREDGRVGRFIALEDLTDYRDVSRVDDAVLDPGLERLHAVGSLGDRRTSGVDPFQCNVQPCVAVDEVVAAPTLDEVASASHQ